MSNIVRKQVIARYPGVAEKALRRSKAACVRLHCQECQGDSTKRAIGCDLFSCFLWPAVNARVKHFKAKGIDPLKDASIESWPVDPEGDGGPGAQLPSGVG